MTLILIIAVLDATRVFRLAVRSRSMNVVVMDFVEAARLQGEKLPWIMVREVLPNIMPPLIAEFGLRFCLRLPDRSRRCRSWALASSRRPPTGARWCARTRRSSTSATSRPLLPAAAIALLTVSVNFVVDWFLHKTSGLRDV